MVSPSPNAAKAKPSLAGRIGGHLRAKLIAGVFALVPLVATILILRLVFNSLDGMVQPLVEEAFGRRIVGVGIGITIVAVYVMGLIATNVLGKVFIRWFEVVVLRVPIVRFVYNIAKQIVDALSAAKEGPSRVVLIEWPREGMHTIGFLTSIVKGSDGRSYCNVLVPTTPTPQSGLLAIVPEEDVAFTDMTVEEGIKLVVSSGFVTPADMMKKIKLARKQKAQAPAEAEALAGTEQ